MGTMMIMVIALMQVVSKVAATQLCGLIQYWLEALGSAQAEAVHHPLGSGAVGSGISTHLHEQRHQLRRRGGLSALLACMSLLITDTFMTSARISQNRIYHVMPSVTDL
jgi:hypothetical protein